MPPMPPALPAATLLVLDVNETLSDLAALEPRFADVGADPARLPEWFAATLRDGFALTVAGAYRPFAQVAAAALAVAIAGEVEPPRLQEAVEHVLEGLATLPLHEDVAPALLRLRGAGRRLLTLTIGEASSTVALLQRHGVEGCVEACLSVDAVRRWKPAPEPYRMALERADVHAERALMVAVHPWDIDGAKRVGMRACWINRRDVPYPEHFLAPDLTCRSFTELADALGA